MEKLDKIYYVISQNAPKVYEDLLLVDGAIEQINIEYKKEILKKFKAKYYITLNKLKYYLYDNKIEKKIERDVTSYKKALNTKLGTLKLFLIRATLITLIDKYELEALIEEIARVDDVEKLDECFARIDEITLDYTY